MTLTSTIYSAFPWRVRELETLHTTLRARSPISARVSVVGVSPGIGTSVAAGMAAAVLSAHGGHRVLAVNSSGSGQSLLWHAGHPPQAPSTPEEDNQRTRATLFDEVADLLPRAASGVYCLELTDPDKGRWHRAAAPIGRFFDYMITDWGYRDRAELGSIVLASTLTCVVAPADRVAVQHAVDIAGAARETGGASIVVITDPGRSWNPAWQEILTLLPLPAVHIAYDKAHSEDAPRSSRRLSSATRLSGLRLAAALTHTTTEDRRQ